MARRARSSARVWRRRALFLAALLLLVAGGGVAAGLLAGGRGGTRAPASSAAPTTSAPSGSAPTGVPKRGTPPAPGATSQPAPAPRRSLAVTSTVLPLVDQSRPVTEAGDELAPARSLPTTVWLPTGDGRDPLIVFASGYDVGPATYQRFCATLASAGYVVAAPSFPLEDPAQGFPLDRGDLPNEAGDVAFVISQLLSGSLAGRIDPSQIGVVGHSDGADVALMVGYEQGTSDVRPSAVVAIAPDPIGDPLGPVTRPLLLVQGSADSVVPYSASQSVFSELSQAGGAVWYLTLEGADHLPPIAGGTPWTPLLDGAVASFLDTTVAHRGPGPGALAAQLGGSSLEQLQMSSAAQSAGA